MRVRYFEPHVRQDSATFNFRAVAACLRDM